MKTTCYNRCVFTTTRLSTMRPALLLCCLLMGGQSFGQLLSPDPERATLVFFREFPSRYGGECGMCNYQISVNGRRICNLSENRYLVYRIKAGTLIIKSRPAGISFNRRAISQIMLSAEVNKVYFIRCDQRTDETVNGRGALVMTLNDVAKALPTLVGMKEDVCAGRL